MINHKLSLGVTLILVMISSILTYFLKDYLAVNLNTPESEINSDIASSSDAFIFDRIDGYELINPLVFAEHANESKEYAAIKLKLSNLIEQYKQSNILMSASIYLEDFKQGEWMSINQSETYYPGSLIKIAALITYLRMSEEQLGLLDKKLSFTSPKEFIPNQTFKSKQIELNKSYSIRELLRYMISYSDNNATYLLRKNVDGATYFRLFKDLRIPGPTPGKSEFQMTAGDFSVFFKVIYNAGYLSRENSEFAAELLKECDFKFGMVKGVPENTIVAHKFGEMGDATTRQLHESGLVYVNKTPYLLTIMTKGYDIKQLPEVISSISKMVFEDFKQKVPQ